ncbi:hypothetical protein AB6A40_005965 [Gnathostoma spinigerum]|uniref:Armadillo repeat-containing protein 8 n=1 Tax=Gnathostoma spinigerum TaxID=75299 RepID=A0ABD6EP95_9BILA
MNEENLLEERCASVFDILASLIRVEECRKFDSELSQICSLIFRYLRHEQVGCSALRCLHSLVRLPLPSYLVREFANNGETIRFLLSRTDHLHLHFMLRILSVCLQDTAMKNELANVEVKEYICRGLFLDNAEEVKQSLECIYHFRDVLNTGFWSDAKNLERFRSLISPFFPTNVQICAVRCIIYGFEVCPVSKDVLLKCVLTTLLRCARSSEGVDWRSQAVQLLSSCLRLRSYNNIDEDTHFLREMFKYILSSDSNDASNNELESNALLVISQLLLDSETCRLIVLSSCMTSAADRITRESPDYQIKALLRALHSLSRSPHHLKTTFNNQHFVKFALDCLLYESDTDYLILATALIANLSLHFCSCRAYLVGAIAPLSALARRNRNQSVTLNTVWALMNLSCRSAAEVKLSIMNHFGSNEALVLMENGDEHLFLRLLSLYRNLYCQERSSRESVEVLESLNEQSQQNARNVLTMIKNTFASEFSPKTKEMALNLLSNLCAMPSCQSLVAKDETIIGCIMNELRGVNATSHYGAVLSVYNLLLSDERNRPSIRSALRYSSLPYLLSHVRNTSVPSNVLLIHRIEETIMQLL